MNNFILLLLAVLLGLSYVTVRSYLQMSQALNAKKIHEKMVQDRFWRIQKSFEE